MPSVTPCEVCASACTDLWLRDGSRLMRCTQCSHVMRTLDDSPAHHRSLAYGGDPGLDRIRLGLTLKVLRDVAGGGVARVFELGFGAGQLLRAFLDSGAQVSGCDPDQLGSHVDADVVAHGDLRRSVVEDVPTEGVDADLVYGVHVIEHVQDPVRALRTCHDLLRPGGRLALMTPAADSWSLRVFSQSWWLLEDPTHVRFFTARSMRRALRDAGFEDVIVSRLLLDNLTMEGASTVRALSPRHRPQGVLAARSTRWVSTAAIPFALVLRILMPRWRPTMLVTARRPR
jgi:SAM-dependent methyltransferase